MDGPPATALRKPCCVCDAPNGRHCAKCKSRYYCSKACQLVDWNELGHKAQCKQMAAYFQDRLLEEIMPAKLKIKEGPGIVEDVAPSAGSKARLSTVRTTAAAKATAVNCDAHDWRGTCDICFEVLRVEAGTQRLYVCCCKKICTGCSDKCNEYNMRCPFCRTPAFTSDAETLRRLQKHVDEGNAEAQLMLAYSYRKGNIGLKQSPKRAFQLYELAAAQGHAVGQTLLAWFYESGQGVKINYKTAAQWYRRAAEQGYPDAQCSLGVMFANGKGVAQSYKEAVKWWRLATGQGHADALYNLGTCYADGNGVPQDDH